MLVKSGFCPGILARDDVMLKFGQRGDHMQESAFLLNAQE
jgi:hypothetical protein